MLLALDSGPSREPRFTMGLLYDVGPLFDYVYIMRMEFVLKSPE